ncbi:MAG: spore protease YyaC [Alicyclobacillus sp.]|nr:spore protease YyaC [Alicyclobacillus sp.]
MDAFPTFRIPFDDESAVPRLSAALDHAFQRAEDREIVVVCVGTDRSTGDAFGPIIGTKLQHSTDVTVYGTLDEPVHAVNLGATLERLQKRHGRRPFVLAIDACLGRFDHVGQIILEQGPLRPGAGVKKSLPEFGDFTLTGVVNVCGFMEYFVLQNTRLGVVMRMTDTVVEALRNSLYRLQTRRRIMESVQGQ